MFNRGEGIYLGGVTKSNISITITAHNHRSGLVLRKTNNTNIVDTTAMNNK